jgi:hypothetical protein
LFHYLFRIRTECKSCFWICLKYLFISFCIFYSYPFLILPSPLISFPTNYFLYYLLLLWQSFRDPFEMFSEVFGDEFGSFGFHVHSSKGGNSSSSFSSSSSSHHPKKDLAIVRLLICFCFCFCLFQFFLYQW